MYSCNLCGFTTDNYNDLLKHRPSRYATVCAGLQRWITDESRGAKLMTEHDALHAIHQLMDKEEWSADTLDGIARILEQVGLPIRDCQQETE